MMHTFHPHMMYHRQAVYVSLRWSRVAQATAAFFYRHWSETLRNMAENMFHCSQVLAVDCTLIAGTCHMLWGDGAFTNLLAYIFTRD